MSKYRKSRKVSFRPFQKVSGSWFSYNETKLAQGREAVKKLLQDNQELAQEIETKIREALSNVQD